MAELHRALGQLLNVFRTSLTPEMLIFAGRLGWKETLSYQLCSTELKKTPHTYLDTVNSPQTLSPKYRLSKLY